MRDPPPWATYRALDRTKGVPAFCFKWLARVGTWDQDQGQRVPDRVYVGLKRLAQWADK